MTITNAEYWKEVNSSASYIVDQAIEAIQLDDPDWEYDREQLEEEINDCTLHEHVDGHQWIIYTAYHLPILQHSDNPEYMIDNLGGAEEVLKASGLDGLHQALAFWAFYADIQEVISGKIDEHESEQE